MMSSEAVALIREVKKYYSSKDKIMNNFHGAIPIERGYLRLAIVQEEEQREKMREQFAGSNDQQSDGQLKLFQDKRLTCFEQIYGAKKSVELKDIFEPDKEGKNKGKTPKKLLILGRAGIGKSTLCQHIAYDWANPNREVELWQENGKERFKLVVWVPLRNLLNYSSDEQFPYDAVLKEAVPEDHTGEKALTRDQVQIALKKLKPEEILYILDGYDEVAGRENDLIRRLLSQENIVLTSRPHGVEQCLASVSMDRKLENIGFLDEDIEEYVKAFFGKNEEGINLINFLKVHPNIWGIAHIPINLMLICVGWQNNYERFDPKEIKDITITDLYLGLVANLGRRYLDKQSVEGLNKFGLKRILNHEKCKSVLVALSELAFEQMDGESLLIPGRKLSEDKLSESYPNSPPSFRDDVINFGVLTSTKAKTDSEKTEFYFVHLTFQEFLAAYYIAEKLRTNPEKIKRYISSNKYSTRYEMVWWFVAGLLKEETEVLERFFDILEAEPRDLAQIYHQMLLMRCMDECQLKVASKRKEKFFAALCKVIEMGVCGNTLFYGSLEKYLQLSPSLIFESILVWKFQNLLNDENTSFYTLSILIKQVRLPKEIIEKIVLLFRASNPKIKDDVLKIFLILSEFLSEQLLEKIELLLYDSDLEVRTFVSKCLGIKLSVPNDFLDENLSLARRSSDEVKGAMTFYLPKSLNLPEEILNKSILFDEDLEGKWLGFYSHDVKNLSKETIGKIVSLLSGSNQTVKCFVVFCLSRQLNLSEEI